MQIQIKGVVITVVKIEHRRMLLSGNLNIPFFMEWDRTWKRWVFTDAAPKELQNYEKEISIQIENHEDSIS